MMLGRRFVAGIVVGLGLFEASSASAKVVDCEEVATRVLKKLHAPMKPIADKDVRKCVAKANVLPENLVLFVAAAFYDRNSSVREDALSKLESYDCKNRPNCEKLFYFMDKHVNAIDAKKSSKDFQDRAEHLRALTKARIDSGTLPK